MSTAIVWFRQDLRCQDNPALATACKHHQMIIPVYIADNNPLEHLGGAQGWWLHYSLLALQHALQQHGLRLCLKRGSARSILQELISEHHVDAVYWNRCYEPARIQQDTAIKAELKTMGLTVNSFNSHLLQEPWAIKNKSGANFKVFTPYWNQCMQQIELPATMVIEEKRTSPDINSDALATWNLCPANPDWASEFATVWEPGELGANQKLHTFIEHHLHHYKNARDEPYKAATSRLSPHLHFGEISPWQIWQALEAAKMTTNMNLSSIEHFQSELGWREFSYHLLYHYPDLATKNFRQEFDTFPWHEDPEALTRWQQGTTGFPIVDAGMRELWQTGYMHNRVRMIVASFLVKDLLIDWRKGAEWFWYTLLDADLANNSASWQWVAGSGADSAPYFRIFNPTLQGEKFDPQGYYVKKWIPELANVPPKWIHKPWQAPKKELSVTLGKDYPYPIVDHAHARKIALAAYQSIK